MCEVKPEKGAEKMKVYCQFAADGSFSICEGDSVLLENCFPGIDGSQIKPVKAEIFSVEESGRVSGYGSRML